MPTKIGAGSQIRRIQRMNAAKKTPAQVSEVNTIEAESKGCMRGTFFMGFISQ
jgi:hypothetical protein